MLIVAYVGLVAIGDLADYFISGFIENRWGPTVGLTVFLTLFFVVLWAAWLAAVRLTRARPEQP